MSDVLLIPIAAIATGVVVIVVAIAVVLVVLFVTVSMRGRQRRGVKRDETPSVLNLGTGSSRSTQLSDTRYLPQDEPLAIRSAAPAPRAAGRRARWPVPASGWSVALVAICETDDAFPG